MLFVRLNQYSKTYDKPSSCQCLGCHFQTFFEVEICGFQILGSCHPGTRSSFRLEVRFCVDGLGARRIAHGVLAMEDDELILHLAKLGVCPGSKGGRGFPGLGPVLSPSETSFWQRVKMPNINVCVRP